MLSLLGRRGSVIARRTQDHWLRNARYLSNGLPSHTKLELPALSPTMTEGVIANWVKQEGDAVQAGQPVCEIETDKATVDYEVQDEGFLAKILVAPGGQPKPCGTVIGILVENKEDIAAFANVTADQFASSGAAPKAAPKAAPAPAAAPAATPASAPTPKAAAAPAPTRASGSRIFISPYARASATEKGLDISQISGTGPNGRIIKADIDRFVASGGAVQQAQTAAAGPASQAAAVSVGDGYFDRPVAASVQELAAQLERSKKYVPHYYVSSEVDITDLLALREKLNASLSENEKISVNDFIVRAAALSMKQVPEVNSSWGGSFIRQYQNCDINIAMLSKDNDGVLMPRLKAANNKGLSEISLESRKFLDASADELDLATGTFTISNMGAFGLKSFTPIVREPQTSSLGVGTISKRAVPGDGVDENGVPKVKVITSMTVTLSSDHRVLDGALAATWLQHFKSLMQDPLKMLL